MKYFLTTLYLFVFTITGVVTKSNSINIYHVKKEKKYLPVWLSVNDNQVNDFYFYSLIYLKAKGIKTISKQDAKDLFDQEIKNVLSQYYKVGADAPDFEEIKRRMANDLSYVVNKIDIKIKVNEGSTHVDSFMVSNFPLPINLGNPYKRKWTSFDLSKIDTLPLANFAVAIMDSVINANILLKER